MKINALVTSQVHTHAPAPVALSVSRTNLRTIRTGERAGAATVEFWYA